MHPFMKSYLLTLLLFITVACGQMPQISRGMARSLTPNITPASNSSKPLRIIAIDVGQGDATLIVAPTGEAMLIDAGSAGAGKEIILPSLESEGIDELWYIVLTHYHEDHIGGVPEVIAGLDGEIGTGDDFMPMKGFYDHGEPEDNPESYSFHVYESQTANYRHTAHPGERLGIGDVDVEVVATNGMFTDGTAIDLGDPPDENAASIAILIRYNGFKMLIAADITGGGGDPPWETPDLETPLGDLVGDIDILRVAHHGSNTSTNQAFLDATTPEAAIISVGDENAFSHPHPSVINRLINGGITTYQTERGWLDIAGPTVANGNIAVEVKDNGAWRVEIE